MRGSFHWVNWPGREVDNSPPSFAEVKNEWSYTSSPPICFVDVVQRGRNLWHMCSMLYVLLSEPDWREEGWPLYN